MARLQVKTNPQLTKEKLMQIFSDGLKDKYEIYQPVIIGSDFALKKTAWTGMAIKLIQNNKGTFIRFNGFIPSVSARLFLGGLIALLILQFTSWKEMQKDLSAFIQSHPDLAM